MFQTNNQLQVFQSPFCAAALQKLLKGHEKRALKSVWFVMQWWMILGVIHQVRNRSTTGKIIRSGHQLINKNNSFSNKNSTFQFPYRFPAGCGTMSTATAYPRWPIPGRAGNKRFELACTAWTPVLTRHCSLAQAYPIFAPVLKHQCSKNAGCIWYHMYI